MRIIFLNRFHLQALGLFVLVALTPGVVSANATYTTGTTTPYVNGIALKVGSDFISTSAKTNQNITVVVSVESLGKSYTIDTPLNSDSRLFTDNGSFEFTFHDVDGNTGSSTITIDNIDRTPPVITVNSFSVTPTNQDVQVNVTTNEGTINSSTHTFTENGSFDFVATDEAGNVATSTVAITHIDKTAPVIVLKGDQSIQIRAGSDFVDEGTTASDNMDTSVVVVRSGALDTATAGTYTLMYSATDTAGNSATSLTRVVDVVRRTSGGGGGGGSHPVATAVAIAPFSGRVLGAATYIFTNDLELGAKGEDVTALQDSLRDAGFFTEASSGFFGPKTKAALMAYQKTHNIKQTGVFGPITRASISGGVSQTHVVPNTVEAQITLLLAQVKLLQAKLAALAH